MLPNIYDANLLDSLGISQLTNVNIFCLLTYIPGSPNNNCNCIFSLDYFESVKGLSH